MRFTVAWADTLSQNTLLKWLLFSMTVLCVVLGSGLICLAQKEPLIIERACFSKLIATHDGGRTNGDVKAFVMEAISQRFDSGVDALSFLGAEERAKTLKEREDLLSKKVRQKVLISSITIRESTIAVDADRIISLEEVRTAFRFPLEVSVKTVPRSESNPYGLILAVVTQLQTPQK